MSRNLIVSIHDVRPHLEGDTRQMLEILAQEGVQRTSLLVIPNFHHQEPLERFPNFVAWLQELAGQGHEVVLHGFYHHEERVGGTQSLMEYLVSRHYTNGEGEFYRLDQATAKQRLAAGMHLFKRLKLHTNGFTAPAWLYSRDALAALKTAGFRYYTTLSGVQPLCSADCQTPCAHHQTIVARAVVWSHRAKWRRLSSNAVLPWIAKRLIHQGQPLRIALHPPDFRYPSIRRCALRILRDALIKGYQPITYLDLVAPAQSAPARLPNAAQSAPHTP